MYLGASYRKNRADSTGAGIARYEERSLCRQLHRLFRSRYPNPFVKVVFLLPNGNAIVIMKPEVHDDGSLSVTSSGRAFGDPGFYFVVHDGKGQAWARYLPSLKETIRVYAADSSTVRADHVLWIWGIQFLRLHYRMRLKPSVQVADTR